MSSDYYSPHTRILLFTPPPIQEERRAQELASRDPPEALDRSWDNTKLYVDAVKEVSTLLKVPVVDIWDLIWTAAGEQKEALSMFLSDGLHLTKEGYEVCTVYFWFPVSV